MSMEHAHSGEFYAKKLQESKEPLILSLNNPQVQVSIVRAAFPNQVNPMEKWLSEESGGSLARRFRAYVEDPDTASQSVDVHDPNAMQELFKAVRQHPPETIH